MTFLEDTRVRHTCLHTRVPLMTSTHQPSSLLQSVHDVVAVTKQLVSNVDTYCVVNCIPRRAIRTLVNYISSNNNIYDFDINEVSRVHKRGPGDSLTHDSQNSSEQHTIATV